MNKNSLKNLKLGTKAWTGKHHSEEWKQAHSKRMNGKGNAFYGKKHSDETLKKMRDARVGRVGVQANNWQGGKTDLKKLIKTNFKYRQWRSDVFTRDEWTCQECNQKVANIEAHHIKELAVILKEYDIKTIEQALACEALWDINNGITLCFGCHETKHKRLKNLRNREAIKL